MSDEPYAYPAEVGDHVRCKNGRTGVVIRQSDHGPWCTVKYDKPSRYKDGVIRCALVDGCTVLTPANAR